MFNVARAVGYGISVLCHNKVRTPGFLGSSRLSREVEKKWWPHCRGWLVTVSKLLATDHANCCLFTGPPKMTLFWGPELRTDPAQTARPARPGWGPLSTSICLLRGPQTRHFFWEAACQARLRTPLNKHLLVERPPKREMACQGRLRTPLNKQLLVERPHNSFGGLLTSNCLLRGVLVFFLGWINTHYFKLCNFGTRSNENERHELFRGPFNIQISVDIEFKTLTDENTQAPSRFWATHWDPPGKKLGGPISKDQRFFK